MLIGDFPAAPGAYALIIHISSPFIPSIAPPRDIELVPGSYLYAGSAYGRGGIRARVLRHLKRKKLRHWHIDHLTCAFGVDLVAVFEGGKECAIVGEALTWEGVTAPIPGFGSSDCRTCPSHLLKLPDGMGEKEALEKIAQNVV